jgi:CBS domain-containing protein
MTTKALVKEFMTRHPVTVSGSTSVLEAWTLMRDRHIRRLPVVDGQRVVGILTLGDLREAHAEEAVGPGMRVSVVMRDDPITVTPATTLRQAAQIMVEKKVSGLPVVADGALVGIITESDLFRALIAHETDAMDPQPIGVVEGDAF